MTNLLITINHIADGGPSKVIENLVRALNPKKYNITLLTLIDENNNAAINRLQRPNVKIITLNYPKNLQSLLKNRQKIIQTIQSTHPDIIHAHGIVPTFIAASKQIKNTYRVATIHNVIQEDYRYTYGKHKGFIFVRAHLLALRQFDQIICCSKASYNAIKKYFKNVSYINNGIDAEQSQLRATMRKKYNIKPTDIVYVYAGKVSKLKRVKELVELFLNSHSQNEYLLIVGDGEYADALQQIKNPHIIFVGFQSNISDYLAMSDVYVSNSVSEGLPISIIEALGSGLPLLLSDIPAHKDLLSIDNVRLGESFTEDNFSAKKHLVASSLSTFDRSSIKDIQKRHLSASQMATQYEKIYNQALKEHA